MSKKIQEKMCQCCGKTFPSNKIVIYNKKSYCTSCYELAKRNANEYKELIKYICNVFDIQAPTGFILKQIKNMKDKNNWSYSAILYTLWYCFEILEKPLYVNHGIGFIEQYYEQARDFYEHQERLRQTAERLSVKAESIKRIKSYVEKPIEHKNNLININSLLTGQEGE